MSLTDLSDWLSAMEAERRIWYVKRLAANDTLATGSHQAGPYVPKDLLFSVFLELDAPATLNPDVRFNARVDSHSDERQVRAIWYNNRLHGDGTRNEARVTNWGGASSPLLDPENTGALAILAFAVDRREPRLRVWVCRNSLEEDVAEDLFGPIEPGVLLVGSRTRAVELRADRPASCRLSKDQLPPGWLAAFPSGAEIVRKVVDLRPLRGTPDEVLLSRRACEYELFLSVEHAIETPRIAAGFESIDDFVKHAQTILQRRKARSGRSLELQVRQLLLESSFREGVDFDHQPESEDRKRPDFLFPSARAYRDPSFDVSRLRMLAVKTTCKDRWRQVINEADRIPRKHLLTLQEGVSEAQFREMQQAGVSLVVPAPLLSAFPESVQPELVTLTTFIRETSGLREPGATVL